MVISSAAKQRADKLEKMAQTAIAEYSEEVAGGGEPPFPDWAMDILVMLDLAGAMVLALKLAHEALEHSSPIMISFPAPMKQHYDAKFAARKAMIAAGAA